MIRPFRFLGSIKIAVPLLVTIAVVLGWGTFYEARFGTAAVQHFIYQSWWFQALLGFLVLNLAVAALSRFPWKKRHIPFVLAHIGIISTLAGGIIGGRLGIEGQMIIPEGDKSSTIQLPYNVLAIHQPNPGITRELRTNFEATAWNHEPHALFEVPLEGKAASAGMRLVVDRYYPNAEVEEEVTDTGTLENPAVHLKLSHGEEEEAIWLLANDPDRFGARWGQAHIIFLIPASEGQLTQWLATGGEIAARRGILTIQFPGLNVSRDIPVPLDFKEPLAIEGTPYTVTFKDYFDDFSISEHGPVNRSDQPNNPAVAFTLTGPEGTDPYLVFSFHPEFSKLHGRQYRIHAHIEYAHPAAAALPPNSIGIVQLPSGTLAAVLTGGAGQKETIQSLQAGGSYVHPWLDYTFEVTAIYPQAAVVQHFANRDNEVRQEVIHVVAQRGEEVAQGWVGLRGSLELPFRDESLFLEYRPGERQLGFAVKLLDFRKTDYPGTQMAAGFESDVELTDEARGLTLKRTINMNNPLKHRGFSLFQSSYIPALAAERPEGGGAASDSGSHIQEPVQIPPDGGTFLDRNFKEATVLSVRKDPGVSLVYAGFLLIVAGVVSMFVLRKPAEGIQS